MGATQRAGLRACSGGGTLGAANHGAGRDNGSVFAPLRMAADPRTAKFRLRQCRRTVVWMVTTVGTSRVFGQSNGLAPPRASGEIRCRRLPPCKSSRRHLSRMKILGFSPSGGGSDDLGGEPRSPRTPRRSRSKTQPDWRARPKRLTRRGTRLPAGSPTKAPTSRGQAPM